MAKKNPPRGVGKNGLTTATAYINRLSETIAIEYSLDVANADFLYVKSIIVSNTLTNQVQRYLPGSGGFDAYFSDKDFKDALATSVGIQKQDILSQGTNAYLDAVQAANKSGTFNYWDKVATNPNPNSLQPPISGIATSSNLPAPAIATSGVFPATIDQIGIDSGEEFIASIVGKSNAPLSLKYPVDANYGGRDNVAGGQDFLAIEQFIYRPPQADLFNNLKGKNQANAFVGTIENGLQRNSNLRKYLGLVRLPIPNNLSMSNGIDWGDSRANPLEAGAFFAANSLASSALNGNVGQLFTGAFAGAKEFLDLIYSGGFGPGTAPGTLLSAFLAQYGLGKVGINVDPAQFIARGSGNTINPNLELLFSGPKLRNFAFQFKFAPNDTVEADECRRILRFFKQGMAAKRGSGNQLFLGSPNVFRLRYLTKNNDTIRSLPRYKICALTSTDIDYSPGPTYQSYDDEFAGSQTTMMNMTLNFTELTPIFESDYREFDTPSQQDLFSTPGGNDIDSLGQIDQINSYDVGF